MRKTQKETEKREEWKKRRGERGEKWGFPLAPKPKEEANGECVSWVYVFSRESFLLERESRVFLMYNFKDPARAHVCIESYSLYTKTQNEKHCSLTVI